MRKVLVALGILVSLAACEKVRDGELTEVTLTRVTARVLRYDCAGVLQSDQVEEVDPPNHSFRIDAAQPFDHSEVISERLPDETGVLMYHGPSHAFSAVTFTIHVSDTLLSYQTPEGDNPFRIEFYDDANRLLQTVRFTARVKHAARFDTQTRERRQSTQDCAPH